MITQEKNNTKIRNLLIPLIDLTSLNATDTAETIQTLCTRATTPFGNVAAVCIYPQFITVVKNLLKKIDPSINIATVVNFPEGELNEARLIKEIEEALQLGANEIDVVFPYKAFLAGKKQAVLDFLQKARNLTNAVTLKVILETGEIKSPELIHEASTLVIQSKADFIKTSTGKTSTGATLEASAAILQAILDMKAKRPIGIKISGGVKTVDQAMQYISQAQKIMGEHWISSRTFRIGASSLMEDLLNNS